MLTSDLVMSTLPKSSLVLSGRGTQSEQDDTGNPRTEPLTCGGPQVSTGTGTH